MAVKAREEHVSRLEVRDHHLPLSSAKLNHLNR